MSVARAAIVILGVLVAFATAQAQPAAGPPSDSGFIGKDAGLLEIDDCPVVDPSAAPEQLIKRGDELYQRGAVLYEQGDYSGAVREFVSAYCTSKGIKSEANTFYTLLKNIGQAYERSLDYEKAVHYFERYVRELPASAAGDKQLFESRISVLRKLRAQILVETSPPGATVTISNEIGRAGFERAGKQIEVPGGKYKMLVELPGYEAHTQDIEVRIGKPFAFFVALRPLQGRLSVQVAPADARVFLRDNTVERFVGVGRVDEVLPTGTYVLIAEAPDRLKVERRVEVLPNQVNRMQLELPLQPEFARGQLVAFATIGGGVATGGMLYTIGEATISGLGVASGAALGLFGSLLYLPEQIPRGTSNLTITAGLTGAVAGTTTALLFSSSGRAWWPAQSFSALAGAGVGYYLGRRTNVTPGDAALFNSAVLWGTTAGALFALSFDAPDREVSAGLVLSGLAMGGASGALMGRYFEISRRRAVLVDIGGIVGLLGGLAAESLAYPATGDELQDTNEHRANFMLGGLAVGLVAAGILTRRLDEPKVQVKPAVGAAVTASGQATPIYGFSGAW